MQILDEPRAAIFSREIVFSYPFSVSPTQEQCGKIIPKVHEEELTQRHGLPVDRHIVATIPRHGDVAKLDGPALAVPLNFFKILLRQFHARTLRTMPLLALTSTRSPFFKTLVAIFVPTIQGTLSCRATMAACEVNPPSSVTMALARCMSGKKSG